MSLISPFRLILPMLLLVFTVGESITPAHAQVWKPATFEKGYSNYAGLCQIPQKKTQWQPPVLGLEPAGMDLFIPFQVLPIRASWYENVAIGDVNHDGLDDILINCISYEDTYEDKLVVLLQQSNGTLATPAIYDGVGAGRHIVIGDVNGDGLNDVVASESKGISVYYQNKQGTLYDKSVHASSNGLGSRDVRIGDFNQDGRLDVISLTGGPAHVDVFLQDASGALIEPKPYDLSQTEGRALEVGDITGDGLTDVVVAIHGPVLTSAKIGILVQMPNGDFMPPVYYQNKDITATYDIGIGDVNGDARNDLVLCCDVVGKEPFQSTVVFYQNLIGELDEAVFKGFSSCPILVEELDGDGRAEVLILPRSVLYMNIYWSGNLDEVRRVAVPYSDFIGRHGLGIGDVNHDGAKDVVVSGSRTRLGVLYGKIPFQVPPLRITGPNGGQRYEPGRSCPLTWKGGPTSQFVKLEYSLDNGQSWNVIGENIANNGRFAWIIPEAQSDQCIVRVSSLSGGAQDISDSCFIITPRPNLTLKVPNGFQYWEPDQAVTIAWTSKGMVSKVDLAYSVDDGSTWALIAQSVSNTGTYVWSVPHVASSNCRIRVSDSDSTLSDASDACFAIGPRRAFTLKAPNGGDYWQPGQAVTLAWEYQGLISKVDLAYSLDGGANWTWIARSVTNTGSYVWSVPYVESPNCRVRVSDSESSVSDASDGVFTMGLPRTLTVMRPNGGESLKVRKSFAVTWKSTGFIGSVRLDYSLDGGKKWKVIVPSLSNTGSYLWKVPKSKTKKGLVRVSSVNGAPSDISNRVFRIK